MTPDSFRQLALSLPDAIEGAHMGHADFRVGGKIFASLGYPRDGWAALALTPEDQSAFVKMQPKAFVPVKGKWGEQGATNVILQHARTAQVSLALEAAYETRVLRSRRRARP
jgi:YjbR protein